MSIKGFEEKTSIALSDESLIAQLRSGADAAGEELVRRYCRPVMRYLYRLCGNEQLAEELHQQTWLSVMEHLAKFDATVGTGGFKAWLFRIATNKANDYWRSQSREKAAKSGLRLVINQHAPAAGHRLEATEEQKRLQDAIQRLPDNQREVLLLRYYADLKFVQIAELVGCPLNTALGRMHKAMLKLRGLLQSGAHNVEPDAQTRK